MIPNHQKTNKRIDDILKTTDTFEDSWGIIDGTTDNTVEGITLKGYTLQAEGTPTMDNPIPIQNLSLKENGIITNLTFTKGIRINNSTGVETSNDKYAASDLFPFIYADRKLGAQIRFMPNQETKISQFNYTPYLYFYDDSNKYLGYGYGYGFSSTNGWDRGLSIAYNTGSAKLPLITQCRIVLQIDDLSSTNSSDLSCGVAIFPSSASVDHRRGQSHLYNNSENKVIQGIPVNTFNGNLIDPKGNIDCIYTGTNSTLLDEIKVHRNYVKIHNPSNNTIASNSLYIDYDDIPFDGVNRTLASSNRRYLRLVDIEAVNGNISDVDISSVISFGNDSGSTSNGVSKNILALSSSKNCYAFYSTYPLSLQYNNRTKCISRFNISTESTNEWEILINNHRAYWVDENFEVTQENIEALEEEYKGKTILFPLQPGQKMYEGSMLTDKGIYHTRNQLIIDGDTDTDGFGTMKPSSEAPLTYVMVTLDRKGIYDYTTLPVSLCNRLRGISCKESVAAAGTTEGVESVSHTYWFEGSSTQSNTFCFHLDQDYTIDNESELKTRLSESPITIEYEVAEPYYEEYTEEQQEAWELIKQLRTYDEQTTIMSPATVEMKYVRDNGLSTIYETRKDAEQHHNGIYIVKDEINMNGRTIYYSDGRFVFYNQYSMVTGVYTDSIQDTVSSAELNFDISIDKISVLLRQNPNNVPISYCASIVDSSTWKVDFTVIPQIIDGQGVIPDVGTGNDKIIADIEVEGYWKRDEIEFYVKDDDIEGIQTYIAPRGTTWYDWEGFASFAPYTTTNGYAVFYGDWDDHILCYDKPDDGIAPVMSNELIIPNHTYYTEDLTIG